jgi:hypothetical protein
MSTGKYLVCIAGLAGCASLLIALSKPSPRTKLPAGTAAQSIRMESEVPLWRSVSTTGGNRLNGPLNKFPTGRGSAPISIPMSFEENEGQADSSIEFIGRGRGLTALLTREGLDLTVGTHAREQGIGGVIKLSLAKPRHRRRSSRRRKGKFRWRGRRRLRGESNYFLGNDARLWHTHVAHFERAEAMDVLPGMSVVVYGNEEGIEYDLVLAPGTDIRALRLQVSGAEAVRLDHEGNVQMRVASRQIQMRKPSIYQYRERNQPQDAAGLHKLQTARASEYSSDLEERKPIEGCYLLYADGTIGFHLGPHDAGATLVLDPSLSVAYSSFLGGAGVDSANSIALDSTGKIYVGGTTTSPASFPESGGKQIGPAGGSTDFFIAKIDPAASGASSLLYLTFLGGTGNQTGGQIAVDSSGDLALAGTTTSADYPVTDGSKRTAGSNDIALTEIDPTGATLIYSTLFGGSGAESTQNPGGIALDSSGDIYIASDTTSTDLTTTAGAYQTAYGGGIADGFLAVFHPVVTPHLEYCTYLGINAQVGIGGVAVDAGSNAYVAGFTSDPGTSFSSLNGFQSVFGGGSFDAFLMKLRPSGTGPSDLAYGTFLGGAGLDKALSVAVGVPMPATAYVTGTTESANFPMSGTIAGPQTSLKGTANAFLTAVGQNATTGMTSLTYSTYLGGSGSDTGLDVVAAEANEIYVTGNTTSFDFPWQDNFQPFNGDTDAFVVKLDPTMAGTASLLYASPLGGTAPPGDSAVTNGNTIATDGTGRVYLAGQTTSADFPRAGNPGDGFQLLCTSCQSSPPAADAFVVAIQENAGAAPSASFSAQKIDFGQQTIGAQNIPPLFAGVTNTGDAPLNVASLGIVGTNSSDFSLVLSEACMTAPIVPGATCSFEVSFQPSIVGPEGAFVAFTDDAPGSPQVLQIEGIGGGPLGVPSPPSQDFGSVPVGSSSSLTMSLVNAGNQNLVISNFATSGQGISQFPIQGLTCLIGDSIVPQGSCTFEVSFTPTATGSYSAEIDITDDSGGAPGTQQVIPITGTGVAPAPLVNLLPAMLTFGDQAVGTTSGAQAVTLTNVGGTTLTLTGVSITGVDAASFAILANAGSKPCPVAGSTLAVGAACTVTVNFMPQSDGIKNAILSFADNAAGSPQGVAISGTGVSSVIQLSATSLNFSSQSVGTGTSQTVNVTSTGNSPVGFSSITISGANAGDFTQTNTCFPAISTPGSCTISVTFNPTAAGNRSATLNLIDNALGSPQTVVLTGLATEAGIQLTPTSVNFSSQLIGVPSSAVGITVKNTGQGALVINTISPNSFTGPNAGDFSETNNCSGNIAPGSTCTIQVVFTPACVNLPVARSAALKLTDNAPGNAQTISLAGTATGSFCIAPQSGGTTSAVVTAGQIATYQLDVISVNSFTGSVSMSCSGAPLESLCTVTPGTASLIPNSPTPFQVNVTTTASSLAPTVRTIPSPAAPTSSTGTISRDVFVLLLLGTFLTALGRSAGLRAGCKALAVLFVAAALAMCSGNNTGADLNSGTPAGSSNLIVSASSITPAATRTLTLTLTVTQ